jgi:hypothetical protein
MSIDIIAEYRAPGSQTESLQQAPAATGKACLKAAI